MSFLDKIIDEDEIAELLNEGAKDKNKSTAHRYLETLIKIRGLEEGMSDDLVIQFGEYDELDEKEWEKATKGVDTTNNRELIEELLEIKSTNLDYIN